LQLQEVGDFRSQNFIEALNRQFLIAGVMGYLFCE
jgi:hypothetical protein